VAHIGHSHPSVAAAVARALATVNTNSRYLSGALVEYAERLQGTMPDPLDTVYMTCSGSEANDLAWRVACELACQDSPGVPLHVAVMDHAYHGHTTVCIDLSPYKFDGPGGWQGRRGDWPTAVTAKNARCVRAHAGGTPSLLWSACPRLHIPEHPRGIPSPAFNSALQVAGGVPHTCTCCRAPTSCGDSTWMVALLLALQLLRLARQGGESLPSTANQSSRAGARCLWERLQGGGREESAGAGILQKAQCTRT
jgi:hypothetical protein